MHVSQGIPEEFPSEAEVRCLFSKLLSGIINSHAELDLEVLQKCLAIILKKIDDFNHLQPAPAVAEDEFILFLRFTVDLNVDFNVTRRVSDYSRKIGVSTRRLSVISSKYGGKTAKELINARIIIEAKQKLSVISLPLKSIAAQLGFSDQYQFSTFFKRYTNYSPTNFRKKLINQENSCYSGSQEKEFSN